MVWFCGSFWVHVWIKFSLMVGVMQQRVPYKRRKATHDTTLLLSVVLQELDLAAKLVKVQMSSMGIFSRVVITSYLILHNAWHNAYEIWLWHSACIIVGKTLVLC